MKVDIEYIDETGIFPPVKKQTCKQQALKEGGK